MYWMEDEDHFKFADDIVVDSTKRLYFNDEGGEYIYGDGNFSCENGNLDATYDLFLPYKSISEPPASLRMQSPAHTSHSFFG